MAAADMLSNRASRPTFGSIMTYLLFVIGLVALFFGGEALWVAGAIEPFDEMTRIYPPTDVPRIYPPTDLSVGGV